MVKTRRIDVLPPLLNGKGDILSDEERFPKAGYYPAHYEEYISIKHKPC